MPGAGAISRDAVLAAPVASMVKLPSSVHTGRTLESEVSVGSAVALAIPVGRTVEFAGAVGRTAETSVPIGRSVPIVGSRGGRTVTMMG